MFMMRMKRIILGVTTVMLAFSLLSCKDEDLMPDDADTMYPNALVTVKTASSGETFFWLDAETTLEPRDWRNPFEKETRALLNYTELSDESKSCTYVVRVNWISRVLTKDAVDITKSDGGFGSDPVEILQDWMTVCEDGYMTLHFAAPWGSTTHKVELVRTCAQPLIFSFQHDSDAEPGSEWDDAVVAFKIASLVPKGVKSFSLNWNSFSGVKDAEFFIE